MEISLPALLPFRIKICGVTSIDDATAAMGNWADAIGLNFYPKSKRYVDLSTAGEIALFYSLDVQLVAVTVNASLDEIAKIRSAVNPHWIQLHGDESPEFLRQVNHEFHLPTIRAFPWRRGSDGFIETYLEHCTKLGSLPQAILLDAYQPGEFGGTGRTADWEAIAKWRAKCGIDIPLILAGGLNAGNVAAAISCVRPDAVDTASGVELSPRKKDSRLVQEFVAAAKSGFAKL